MMYWLVTFMVLYAGVKAGQYWWAFCVEKLGQRGGSAAALSTTLIVVAVTYVFCS